MRDAREQDWEHIYPFFSAIVAAGETYAYLTLTEVDRPATKPKSAVVNPQLTPGRPTLAGRGDSLG
jgi:hypothetical protein